MTDSRWQPIETALIIPLTRGQVTLIDPSDESLVSRFSWHAVCRRDGNGYYAVNSAGTRMHRLLLGVWDKRLVDHVDGDGLNNRRVNLRIATPTQNCVNRRTTPGPYLRGVRPQKGKWRAAIKLHGRIRSLGYYSTEVAAHTAYLRAAREAHGDWMPLPDPPEGS